MDYSLLPVFIAITEQGSLTKAAEYLHMTKSAVSKKLAALETQTGIRLVTRTTRHLQLTEAGQLYYTYLKKAHQAVLDGQDALSHYSREVDGTLKISAPAVFGSLHLANIMPEFLQRWPSLQAEMVFDDKLTDLVGEGFDLAVRIGELQNSSLIARVLSPCRSVLCASPAYLARHGTPQDLTDLKYHNCLFYSYFRAGQSWTFLHRGDVVRFTPQGTLRANNSLALHQAVLQGTGICQLPQFIAAPDIRAGRLIPLLPEYPLPLHHIYAVYPDRDYLPKKVSAFLHFLQDALGTEGHYQKEYEQDLSAFQAAERAG